MSRRRMAMLTGTMAKYREMTGRLLMRDENVRLAVYRENVKARGAETAGTDKEAGASALSQMGKAFGVDLGG